MYTNQQLQSKIAQLKAEYITWDTLNKNSGFGFNVERNIPTAPDDVWIEYLKFHPKASQFRYATLHRSDDMEYIFEGKVATGVMASGPGTLAKPSSAKAFIPIAGGETYSILLII